MSDETTSRQRARALENIRARIRAMIAEIDGKIEECPVESLYLSGYRSGLTDAYLATFE